MSINTTALESTAVVSDTTSILCKEVPSTGLKIIGFKRPLTVRQVREMLAQFGTIVALEMDAIKSSCVVEFESCAQATKALAATNGLKFPEHNKGTLSSHFIDLVEYRKPPPPTIDDLFRKTKAKPVVN